MAYAARGRGQPLDEPSDALGGPRRLTSCVRRLPEDESRDAACADDESRYAPARPLKTHDTERRVERVDKHRLQNDVGHRHTTKRQRSGAYLDAPEAFVEEWPACVDAPAIRTDSLQIDWLAVRRPVRLPSTHPEPSSSASRGIARCRAARASLARRTCRACTASLATAGRPHRCPETAAS